jgi:hypothetical protein
VSTDSNDLERFLGGQLVEGELESQGSFTVDLERARSKLIRFGVESPDKALLKLVQAIVLGRPSLIDIKMTADRIVVYADGADRLSKDIKFLQGELGAALWSCVYSGFPEVKAAIPGRAWALQESGVQEAEPGGLGRGDTLSVELSFQAPKGFWENLRSRMRGRNTTAFALVSHLQYCPIHTRLDHRSLNTSQYKRCGRTALDVFLTGSKSTLPHEVFSGAVKETKAKHSFVKDRRFESQAHDCNSFVAVHQPARTRLFGISSESWITVKQDSLLAHLWIPQDASKAPTTLTYVKNGVVVGVRPFEVDGITSASGIDLDASGLAIVENSKLEEFEEYLTHSVERGQRMLKKAL